jgi:hypothetical protein
MKPIAIALALLLVFTAYLVLSSGPSAEWGKKNREEYEQSQKEEKAKNAQVAEKWGDCTALHNRNIDSQSNSKLRLTPQEQTHLEACEAGPLTKAAANASSALEADKRRRYRQEQMPGVTITTKEVEAVERSAARTGHSFEEAGRAFAHLVNTGDLDK